MKRLLIVDNSLQLGHWLQVALAQVDPQVDARALLSGEEALLEGTRYPIDLLVTDIRLTGMSGFDLIRKMRKQHPLLRVIVLTDLAQADLKKQLDEIGVDAFFNKPLKVSLLMDSVASLLRKEEKSSFNPSRAYCRPAVDENNCPSPCLCCSASAYNGSPSEARTASRNIFSDGIH